MGCLLVYEESAVTWYSNGYTETDNHMRRRFCSFRSTPGELFPCKRYYDFCLCSIWIWGNIMIFPGVVFKLEEIFRFSMRSILKLEETLPFFPGLYLNLWKHYDFPCGLFEFEEIWFFCMFHCDFSVFFFYFRKHVILPVFDLIWENILIIPCFQFEFEEILNFFPWVIFEYEKLLKTNFLCSTWILTIITIFPCVYFELEEIFRFYHVFYWS